MADDTLSLVTGAGGFIGAHLCRFLASRRERFVGILSPRSPEPVSGLTPWPSGSFRQLDLRETAAVRDLLTAVQPTRIFNLAAVGTHPHSRWEPAAYVDVNVRLPVALAGFMPAGSILVQIGSMAQYKGSSEPLEEDKASRDVSTLYSWSKNAADSLLETIEHSSPGNAASVIRVRLFGVVGGDEPPHRLLPTVVRGCFESTDVNLSDGNQVRDVLHVEDAVSAITHVSAESLLLGKAVNIGRGEGRTVRWIAERAAEKLSCTDRLRFGAIPRRAYEAQQQLVADISRLRSTGWQPRWTFEESIDRAVQQMVAARGSTPGVSADL